MANSKDNIRDYAIGFIGFDEITGDVYDSISASVGTIYNAPARVEGWNGEGRAISLNGTSQYILFNSQIFKTGTKTIRFKIKTTAQWGNIMTVGRAGSGSTNYSNGFAIAISDYKIRVSTYVNNNSVTSNVGSSTNINDNKWHDIIITVDNGIASIYIDGVLDATGSITEPVNYSVANMANLCIGKINVSGYENFLSAQLDQIEIYDRLISPIPDKYLVLHNNEYKYHDGVSWQVTTSSDEDFILHGHDDLSQITEEQWLELSGDKVIEMWTDFEFKEYASITLDRNTFTAKDIIGDEYDIIIYEKDTKVRQLELTASPSNQQLMSLQDIMLLGVDTIDNIIVNGTGDGKVGFSVDGGTTYKAFREGQWVTIATMAEGNTFAETNTLTSAQIDLLRGESNVLRFSYWITGDTVINDVKVVVSMDGTERFAPTNYYDVEYDMANRKITYTIKTTGQYGFTYTDTD